MTPRQLAALDQFAAECGALSALVHAMPGMPRTQTTIDSLLTALRHAANLVPDGGAGL